MIVISKMYHLTETNMWEESGWAASVDMSKKTVREARVKEVEKRRYPSKHYVSLCRAGSGVGSGGAAAAAAGCAFYV